MTIMKYAPQFLGLTFLFLMAFRYLRTKKRLARKLPQDALVVDVRSPSEFASGHVRGSVNIPLDQLEKRVSELDPKRNIVLCCASGRRSGMAASLLQRKGYGHVINFGSWKSVPQK